MHQYTTYTLTHEKQCLDFIIRLIGRPAYRDDLSEGIDRSGGQSEPALIDGQRVPETSPVELILVHPVPMVPEKVRVVNVARPDSVRETDLTQPVEHQIEGSLADAVELLDGLAILPGELEVVIHVRIYVDRVHDRVLLIRMDQSEHVTYLVDRHLEQVDSGSVRIDALVVLVLVEMDVAGCPRVSQLASVAVERLIAIHVVL